MLDPINLACEAYRDESGQDADPDALRIALQAATAVTEDRGLDHAIDAARAAYSQEVGQDADPWGMRAAILATPANSINKETAIRVLQEHEGELRRRGAISMSLFGSTARDEAGTDSDIDILFEFDRSKQFSLYDVVNIKLYLEGIFERKVDLNTECEIERLWHKIKKDLVKIF